MENFITLQRQIFDWEWYTDVNTCHLFIHCLLRANHTKNHWRGIEIQRGQFISSWDKLARETGLSTQQARTSMKKLIITGSITKQSNNKYTLFTVTNYDMYQSINKQNDKQSTNKPTSDSTSKATNNQQASNKQVTTNNNDNNDNNDNNNTYADSKEPQKKATKRFIKPTVDEVAEYVRDNKLLINPEVFVDYYESNGWMVGKNKMKNWKSACRTWHHKEEQKGTSQSTSTWYDDRYSETASEDLIKEAQKMQQRRGETNEH